jgi:predicted nuclease of predicted toxin-antitoxin system
MKFLVDAQLPPGLMAAWLEARWERVENLLDNGERLIELV